MEMDGEIGIERLIDGLLLALAPARAASLATSGGGRLDVANAHPRPIQRQNLPAETRKAALMER